VTFTSAGTRLLNPILYRLSPDQPTQSPRRSQSMAKLVGKAFFYDNQPTFCAIRRSVQPVSYEEKLAIYLEPKALRLPGIQPSQTRFSMASFLETQMALESAVRRPSAGQ
jgi:hypothetical protein